MHPTSTLNWARQKPFLWVPPPTAGMFDMAPLFSCPMVERLLSCISLCLCAWVLWSRGKLPSSLWSSVSRRNLECAGSPPPRILDAHSNPFPFQEEARDWAFSSDHGARHQGKDRVIWKITRLPGFQHAVVIWLLALCVVGDNTGITWKYSGFSPRSPY